MKSASNRSSLKNQRGRGNLGCLFSFLLLGAIGYLGYKFIPPYVSHFELKDAMDEVAVYEIAGIGVSKERNSGGYSGNSDQQGKRNGN